jgi:hypothetical protein
VRRRSSKSDHGIEAICSIRSNVLNADIGEPARQTEAVDEGGEGLAGVLVWRTERRPD